MKDTPPTKDTTYSRRKAIKTGLAATGAVLGSSTLGTVAAIHYEHELVMESDEGSGDFWCYIYADAPQDYETQNVDWNDLVNEFPNLIRTEFYLQQNFGISDEDIIRWNNSDKILINKYDDSVNARWNGLLLPHAWEGEYVTMSGSNVALASESEIPEPQ